MVLAKEAIRGPYYDLLAKMSVPDCNAVVERVAAAFQKEAAERDKESTTGDSLEASPTEELVAAMVVTNPPLAVPPIAAPAQTTYIATTVEEGDGRSKDARHCSAAPFGCSNLAKDCSRKGWKNCKLVIAKSARVLVPKSEEARAAQVKEYKKELKKLQMRQSRAGKEVATAEDLHEAIDDTT